MIEYHLKTGEDIIDFIYNGNSLPVINIDKSKIRFFHWDSISRFLFNKLNSIFIFAMDDNNVVGLLNIGEYENSQIKNELPVVCISYISIDTDYKNQGHATNMISIAMAYIKSQNKILTTSCYSNEGLLYLKPLLNKNSIPLY